MRFLNFHNQRNPPFRTAHREGLASVFMGYRVMDLQIRIGTAVDNTPTELSFVIWIIEIDDRERAPRISTRVLRFQRTFACTLSANA